MCQVSDAAKKKKLAKNASKTKKLGTAGTAADKSSEQSSPAVSRNQVGFTRERGRRASWDRGGAFSKTGWVAAVLIETHVAMQSSASLAALQGGVSALAVSAQGADTGANADAANGRTVTGVLSSRPTSRDIKIDGFSMGLAGQELIQDCSIEITIGRRYGLIGQNGCGKTNFLQCLANREVSPLVMCRSWCVGHAPAKQPVLLQ